MAGVVESENWNGFQRCLGAMGEKELAPMSVSIYDCWMLFHIRYGTVAAWKQETAGQIAWLLCLNALAETALEQEMNGQALLGTAAGILMARHYFRAVAMKERAEITTRMSDQLEHFNQVGYRIAREVSKRLVAVDCDIAAA